MENQINISATIVIYNQSIDILKSAIDSFLNIPLTKKLFVIDNASKTYLEKQFLHEDLEYIYLDQNIGFGAAHNHVINKLNSDYHLILNPDIEFNPSIIRPLIDKLQKEGDVSFITPKIVYPDSEIQFVCRKHPTFFNLIFRRLGFSKIIYDEEALGKVFYPEFIHGCFMLFKTKEFVKLKGFDKRYFLYLEDADICRKILMMKRKILYYPRVAAIHHHQRGSAKSPKLFMIHTISAIKYFLKWGLLYRN